MLYMWWPASYCFCLESDFTDGDIWSPEADCRLRHPPVRQALLYLCKADSSRQQRLVWTEPCMHLHAPILVAIA